ncbi:hypothetical protein [Mangrovimonas spongiae]|uniref:Cytochrome c domain-containing protein n=1 Tax=Mangrovimonas spongiae TaxID=2494697 RepID=A0A3R9MSM2_9FLAO|nr:hypothetical protein [Mangrovimonas spongiae]RSK39701.1 hypothetical protein EJA19_07385 [Mangrovimonas spongiae]
MKNLVILLFTISALSCTNTSEDDLIDQIPIEDVVTYTNHVKPIIDTNCLTCHSNPPTNGTSLSLTTYSQVKSAVENNNLIGRISSQDPSFLMPFGGQRLPQNLIDLIIQWDDDGLNE